MEYFQQYTARPATCTVSEIYLPTKYISSIMQGIWNCLYIFKVTESCGVGYRRQMLIWHRKTCIMLKQRALNTHEVIP